MKFQNKTTGVILTVKNDFVLDQMRKSEEYIELKEIKIVEKTKSEKTEKKSK